MEPPERRSSIVVRFNEDFGDGLWGAGSRRFGIGLVEWPQPNVFDGGVSVSVLPLGCLYHFNR